MYVIEAEGGPVKVGVAIDPQKRLLSLRTGTPFPLRLTHVEMIDSTLHATSVERAAHTLLSAAHAHGEWFNVSAAEAQAAVQRAICDIRSGQAPVTARALKLSPVLSPLLCRAARALLGWSRGKLSEKCGVGASTLADFEAGKREPYARTLADVRRALEAAGVLFIPGGNDAGPGVRLARTSV